MSRKTRLAFFALALLFAGLFFARANTARAEFAQNSSLGSDTPSVVLQAFRQGQVIGAGQYRAALVVRYEDGGVQTRCVAFDEEEIGGDELLLLSGLDPVVDPQGAVCAINGVGCGPDDCFCECPFPDCKYWAYFHWENNDWSYSDLGPAYYVVKDGALEGWSWGQGDRTSGVPPPKISYEQICGANNSPITPTPTRPNGAPQILTFTAQPTSIQSGACATLSWQTTNASTVLLEGAGAAAQGTQQVCPTETHTYTLIAVSASSQQATQQVTVQVAAAVGATQPTATASVTPTALPTNAFATPDVVRPGMPTPAYLTPLPQPIVTQPPRVIPQPGSFPTPSMGMSPLAMPQLVGGVPLAPTAEPAAVEQLPQAPQGPLPTATRFELARSPTETSRPRRILGDGRPTPTPILVARAGSAPGSGAATTQDRSSAVSRDNGSRALVASRAFDDNLLPQYAAYLATVVILLAMGWLVHRRRNGQPSAVAQPARERDAAHGERVASRDERTA